MIGRADIEGSKSDVAMNAWPPQASSCIPINSYTMSCLLQDNQQQCQEWELIARERQQSQPYSCITPFSVGSIPSFASLALELRNGSKSHLNGRRQLRPLFATKRTCRLLAALSENLCEARSSPF
ncbi:hypothetical protein F5Y07DRAFT_145934 [Xylaria sp. FL0933]|nr:hypothetical protein F5Y07DRAFT_145934 [Xylaria sp. FL0933]